MKKLILGVAVCALTAVTAAAQAPAGDVAAPIRTFIDAFNKGDMAGAAATHAIGPDLVIIDEVPPFTWHGADGFKAWAAALDTESKKAGMTDQKVTISAPTRTELSGDTAYVVVPAVYTFTLKGAAMRESAQITCVLKKGASGWLIAGWTWTGPKPAAAKTAPAPAKK